MISVCVKKIGGISFGVAFEEERIFATNFGSNMGVCLHGLLASLPFNVPFHQTPKASPFAQETIKELKDIYDGKNVSGRFDLVVDRLTMHTQRVISAAMSIPVGYATSYGAIAMSVGGGARSVGHVMAKNPFPPVVPCHRVVGSDLGLRGYGGGLDVKFAFLKREKRGYTSEREVLACGKKLRVFPVEFVLDRLAKL